MLLVMSFRCVKSAQSLFASAEEAYCKKDEERAYILYMRYFNVIQNVKKSAEYKKNKVFLDLFYLYNVSVNQATSK